MESKEPRCFLQFSLMCCAHVRSAKRGFANVAQARHLSRMIANASSRMLDLRVSVVWHGKCEPWDVFDPYCTQLASSKGLAQGKPQKWWEGLAPLGFQS